MGKTRGLFKKIRYTKGIFYAKIGTIKDRNGMDLTEAVDIKKRWQEFTEEQYKKKKKKKDMGKWTGSKLGKEYSKPISVILLI